MKNVKKLLALLMALVMLFAFCACDNDKDDDKKESKGEKLTAEELEGDWEMQLDYNALFNSGVMGEVPEIFEMIDMDTDLTVELDVNFDDGEMEIDPAGMADFMENYLEAVMEWMAEGDNVYELIAMSSDGQFTADEYKDACEEEGVSKSQLLNMMEEQMPDAEDIAGEMDAKIRCYELDGNKLYTWEEDDEKDDENYFQFTYSDEVITVTKVVDDGESTKLDDGAFTFEKK
ncbi:MAG: hypothetical protein IJB36_02605 [Clostridia bacterium]|nr:hypothetical protein [Clostridia bacterium]